jgi:hypothetical protein
MLATNLLDYSRALRTRVNDHSKALKANCRIGQVSMDSRTQGELPD